MSPRASVTIATTCLAFPWCTATALQIMVRIFDSTGTVLATATATLTIQQP